MSASKPPAPDIQTSKMNMVSYQGSSLCLLYPSFLKVKSVEPYWTAMGPKMTCPVYVLVDPDETIVKGFSSVTHDDYSNIMAAFNTAVMRKGNVNTRNGLVGYEQLTKTINPIGEEFWMWIIDGHIGKHKVVVRIDAPVARWGNGKAWNELVNSIQIKGVGIPVEPNRSVC